MSLRIVVCVKYVPDAGTERAFTADMTTDRESSDGLLSELDEHGVEQALRIAEAAQDDVEVTVVTVGPDNAKDALRKALAMGANRAVHISDEDIHGSDVLGTSLLLARAVERIGFDLVLCGMASTDGATGVLPALLAERLDVAQMTLLSQLALKDGVLSGRRDGDTASEHLRTRLPAVASVTDQSGEARYPSFKGIMAAKKKPVETLDLDDLGVEPGEVGLAGAWSTVLEVAARPPRTAGTVVKDEGEGARELAAFLTEAKFI
ncbi:electron transfer flavoprotein subunit beta/FixA family protein [Streptomyces mutabilis]|uniref:Electron transfer flavoprotein subunit beta n=1 Tax=Streptomyces mutabilis TaxID=67332 RepID=A0A086MVH8_9ACTN|nr:electron transfer flavoprotein subunit beta/FixA family protein [Streptomyces mutabilis]KFG72896.1 electron transfer flavoprotein subunit beta [Streptomyces mutabilis]